VAVHTGLLRLETAGDGAVVDLTEGVRSIVARSGVQSGVACAFAVGATVAITTIEYEPGAIADLQALLDRLIAPQGDYRHNALNHDTNAHSHLRAALIGPSETMTFNWRSILNGRTITGIIAGSSLPQVFLPQLLELHARGRFPVDRLMTTFPFEQINEAIAALKAGTVSKAVLTL